MIEVVSDSAVLEVVEADIVPLSRLHYGGRTVHKVVCVECRHQFQPKAVTWTPDGAVCGSCRNDS